MPRSSRLSHADFAARLGGKRLQGALFSLSASPLATPPTKFACVVSAKVAPKAIDRNRIKRRARDIARPLVASMQKACAIVLTAKKSAAAASYEEMRQDITHLIQSLA